MVLLLTPCLRGRSSGASINRRTVLGGAFFSVALIPFKSLAEDGSVPDMSLPDLSAPTSDEQKNAADAEAEKLRKKAELQRKVRIPAEAFCRAAAVPL